MKKLFITTIMTVFAVAGFAQVPTATSGNSQQYFRVTFTVPIVGSNTGSNTSVAATMKDYYTYCNPQHEYLDFQAASPMGFRTTTGSVTETSDFLIEKGRGVPRYSLHFYTLHSYTLHFTLYTLHTTLYTLHSTHSTFLRSV